MIPPLETAKNPYFSIPFDQQYQHNGHTDVVGWSNTIAKDCENMSYNRSFKYMCRT
jgi:hypothetical protein